MGLNLLEKTELWVNEITLANANLSDMADAVAEQLGLDKGKVMVVDVRPRHITFDVLERNVPQAGIMGKERAILSALAALPGVCTNPIFTPTGFWASSVWMWRSLKPYWTESPI